MNLLLYFTIFSSNVFLLIYAKKVFLKLISYDDFIFFKDLNFFPDSLTKTTFIYNIGL